MAPTLTDAQLLTEFATSRNQQAFRELVARHQDMVFSTALRRTGRGDLAADVAQNVFLALATKAAWLSTRTSVGGWLYKSTLLETARRQRDEARRFSRERRYAEEEMKLHSDSTAPDHDDDAGRARQLLPLLDEALSRLSDDDREAVVLRFLRGLSLRDTGAALGTTEEAARKRVSRALEKLSVLFHRRGAPVSATVLATTVLPRAVEAAPSGLTAAWVGAGSSAPATSLGGSLFLKAAALSKAQCLAGCLAVAAVPVGWQAMRIHDLKVENGKLASLTAAVRAPASPPTRDADPKPPAPLAGPRAPTSPDTARGPRHDRRGRFEVWRDLQRQQQREARLAALHGQFGLEDYQLAAIGDATTTAETALRALHDAARDSGTPVDPAAVAAVGAARDQSIAEVLTADQWSDYVAFCREEEQSQREIFANRLLGDLQNTLHLTDPQKDQLFALFASQALPADAEGGRTPIEAMDEAQTEKLAEVLSDEQFRLWRQRAETWAQLFRSGGKNPGDLK